MIEGRTGPPSIGKKQVRGSGTSTFQGKGLVLLLSSDPGPQCRIITAQPVPHWCHVTSRELRQPSSSRAAMIASAFSTSSACSCWSLVYLPWGTIVVVVGKLLQSARIELSNHITV